MLAEIAPAFEKKERAVVNPEELVATDDERARTDMKTAFKDFSFSFRSCMRSSSWSLGR
jgi:hypothetical protein